MNHVMLDLETMGSGPDAAIVAIGAVVFDPHADPLGDLGESFYRTVDLESAVRAGGAIDAGTVLWWLRQSAAARAALGKDAVPLPLVLRDFAGFLAGLGPEVNLWGNGAGFDNVILAQAYRAIGLPVPWKHWNDRCYRTLKALYPEVPAPERAGTAHQALDDAQHQARHAAAMLRARAGADTDPDVTAEIRHILGELDRLAAVWGDEGVFRTCRDRLRALAG